ncbi:hypothetical protein ACGFRG_05815 [Streptomyces sp. NPDC048696]|uniref:hypothetical protein n=1 Tax=Streptomyces sp. NPDC048696 TaxID=3365585 RepID=UPI00371F7471
MPPHELHARIHPAATPAPDLILATLDEALRPIRRRCTYDDGCADARAAARQAIAPLHLEGGGRHDLEAIKRTLLPWASQGAEGDTAYGRGQRDTLSEIRQVLDGQPDLLRTLLAIAHQRTMRHFQEAVLHFLDQFAKGPQ